MVQVRQDLPLGAETIYKLPGNKNTADDLNGNVLLVFVVSPGGSVNHAHAPHSDLVQQFVRSEGSARPAMILLDKSLGRRFLQKGSRLFIGLDERFNRPPDLRIGTVLVKIFRTGFGRQLERAVQ